MNSKSFFKAAVVALTLTTISGIPASPFTATASAAITLTNADHDAKAIEVIEASITALGGRDKLSKIKFVTQTGTISIPMAGIDGTIVLHIASPDRILLTVDFPMMGKNLQGLNDGIMWASDAMNGPRLVPEEESKDMIEQANLLAVLDYAKNNETIEYVEETQFDEQAAHKIRLVDHDGDESIEYYSVESGLLIGTEAEAMTPMGKIKSITTFQDYKELGGHLQPTKMLQKTGMADLVFTFTEADYSEIDDSVFAFPPAVEALIEAAKEKAAP